MIAPGVHRGKRHVRAAASGDTPDDLDVVAEVEGVRLEGQVPGDDDESHHERVGDRAPDRDPRGRDGRQPARGGQRPERYEHRQRDDDLVGAGERATGHREPTGRDHRHQDERDARSGRLQETGGAGHGRRVYRARRLSKRRERRRPRWLSVNQKSTERIRSP